MMAGVDERGRRWWQREWNPHPTGGSQLGTLTVLAMGSPVAGVLLIIDGQVWVGIFFLLCGLAMIFTAWVHWTRPRS